MAAAVQCNRMEGCEEYVIVRQLDTFEDNEDNERRLELCERRALSNLLVHSV